MPFWLSVATFLNGVCWTIYALINSPINIYVLVIDIYLTFQIVRICMISHYRDVKSWSIYS